MHEKPQSGTINQLIQQVVYHCQTRHPEGLDNIFDTLPVDINEQVLAGAIAILSSDIDALSWFCGYLAGEINYSEDNHRPFHPISFLASILINYSEDNHRPFHPISFLASILLKAGMELFVDFTPYPGCRLVIANTAKFESLPQEVKDVVQEVFNLIATPDEQMQQMNDALLQELVVSGE